MQLLKKITDKEIWNSDKSSTTDPRIALRAILTDGDGDMALIYMGKYGFYKVPGGGVEPGETLFEALKREILEETGCQCEILKEIGYVEENRGIHDFTQQSYYYFAKVIGEKGIPTLTPGEKNDETQVVWVCPQQAYDLIATPSHQLYQRKYIQCRDMAVLTKVKHLGGIAP